MSSNENKRYTQGQLFSDSSGLNHVLSSIPENLQAVGEVAWKEVNIARIRADRLAREGVEAIKKKIAQSGR